ncbi:MAG TPA: hypothetical protein VGG22_00205 [Candidatus Baltobacteraceae bacterium]|jgi:hypothetical protein
MPERNRVTPYGEIIVTPLRGNWLGNRGCIHRGYDIIRPWASKHWITCVLEYKGWVAPKWVPGRWTALFFYDEALALAAGHRPCALCRRSDYNRFVAAFGIRGANPIDERLHAERLDQRRKRLHSFLWRELPAGAYVEIDRMPHVVLGDAILPWSPEHGYGAPRERPRSGEARLITPPSIVAAILSGYAPQIGGPSKNER